MDGDIVVFVRNTIHYLFIVTDSDKHGVQSSEEKIVVSFSISDSVPVTVGEQHRNEHDIRQHGIG